MCVAKKVRTYGNATRGMIHIVNALPSVAPKTIKKNKGFHSKKKGF